MSGKQVSGHFRLIVIICILMLALSFTAASAATLNPNLVGSRISQLETVTATPAAGSCPAGCSCMMESEVKKNFGVYTRCSETPCNVVNTGSTTLKAYCFRQGTIPPTITPAFPCPTGCNCLSDAQAKERYGIYTRCSDTVCGYDMPANMVAAYQVPKYCTKQGSTTPACPEGCNCISEAVAKDRYGTYTRCTNTACGYEQDQSPKYCIKPGTTTPACPEGCSCISEATAKARGGTWARCSGDICGYEQSTATLAAVVQVPKYCMKQQETTPVCPEGCACISDEDAKLKGLTDRCDTSQTPCGYRSAATTANQQIPLYCYKIPTTTSACPEGCNCLSEAKAKERYGTYTRCSGDVCGKEVVPAANGIAAYSVPQYCVKQGSTPICPEGCTCISDEDAKLKGLTGRCDTSQTPCGYKTATATATAAAQSIPLYCYKIPTTTPVCPQGCTCITNATGVEKGLTFCGGKVTLCGYNENKVALHCFNEVTTPACTYDYQKNVCSGTCDQGYTCGLVASKKDASGKVVYAACGCTGQPAAPCSYDAQKNVCTGTCQTGAACAVVGKNVDEKTGATIPVCGCPQQSSCSYNYDKEACVGTCTTTSDNCQLNTIYRDPTTGKVTYAECHCKGGGDTTSTCACDAASGSCTGTCASGKACTMTERTTDAAGKVVCKSCGCADTCVLTANNECSGTCVTGAPCARTVSKDASGQEKVSCGCGGVSQVSGTPLGVATRQPGFLESIGSFFNKIFGGK